ncbi:MAG: ATP-dependent Clp protease ATP-binding subunit [Candidatus Riflebacteria bacterium]|nr:ATP-dependent Clp protease ATP-binding subunit [Candidatus Riflebacteria bacterium]
MRVTVPIYVEESRRVGGKPPAYRASALFLPDVARSGELLSRVTSKLATDLERHLESLARQPHHGDLARSTYCPELVTHTLDLALSLRRRTLRPRLLVVEIRALGRRVMFSPSFPEVWFEVCPGQTVPDRAAEVYTELFRRREDADELDDDVTPGLHGKAWVSYLELAVPVGRRRFAGPPSPGAELEAPQVLAGPEELARVGWCLDRLFPDELMRAHRREAEADQLQRLLDGADRRPVLLLGPRLVGKTSLVHEYVRRTVEARGRAHALGRNTWQLSGQRIIAGMSYAGQWEGRLLAILATARKNQHLLYFDDLLGLFTAGISAASQLNVAMILKTWLETRQVRVVAESTPEAFRVLKEQDLRFAELFHVFPVREPEPQTTWRILISVVRDLEDRHACQFWHDALPMAVDLQRRHARHLSFPGKAALFLQQLALKDIRPIRRQDVLDHFRVRTGLSMEFLDDRIEMDPEGIRKALTERVAGQDDAVDAMVSCLAMARARVNDPERPMASLLFLGPTGVGKTRCAKALAEVLFGDPARLIRLDMNEFVSPDAAARLVGTFHQPDGILTSRVRHQPFAVLLLDEIEKAHADVFDVLLQVLGEGRLSDGLGRTVDFTRAIVILTSNLGVREATAQLGFAATGRSREQVYRRAVERFFRPEFFNRLDRVVPFTELDRGHLVKIANELLQGLLKRDGLVRRRCLLELYPGALERIVDEGYDPELGARALRRAVERQVARPVSDQLAGLRPGLPTLICIEPGPRSVAVVARPLAPADPAPPRVWPERREWPALVSRVEAICCRVDEELAERSPDGEIDPSRVTPDQLSYFALKEQVRRVLDLKEPAENRLARGGPRPPDPLLAHGARLVAVGCREDRTLAGRSLSELRGIQQGKVRALRTPTPAPAAFPFPRLLAQVAVLCACVSTGSGRVLMTLRVASSAAVAELELLHRLELETFDGWLGSSCREVATGDALSRAIIVEGPVAPPLATREAGLHLFESTGRGLTLVHARVVHLARGDDPILAPGARQGPEAPGGEAGPASGPADVGPVIRIYHEEGSAADSRSGLACPRRPTANDLRELLSEQLPWPSGLGEAP